jgi:hypothetical protein
MSQIDLDLMEDLGSIMARTADLNRWVLRVCEKGGVSTDVRQDMISAADQIKKCVVRLEASVR